MHTLASRALVALVGIAVLSFVSSSVAPARGHANPYVSPLVDPTGGATSASPQCPNKGCVSPTRCGHVTGAFACTVAGGTCEHGLCR